MQDLVIFCSEFGSVVFALALGHCGWLALFKLATP
jgi:hypothetical protein